MIMSLNFTNLKNVKMLQIYIRLIQFKNANYWRKDKIIVLQFNKVSMKYFYSFSITDLIKLNTTYPRNYRENKNFAHGHCTVIFNDRTQVRCFYVQPLFKVFYFFQLFNLHYKPSILQTRQKEAE